MSSSFSQKYVKKIESTKQQNIFLIRGEDKGLDCWHYIFVDNLKVPLIKAKISSFPCDIDVSQFGRIIISGWGKEPNNDIVKKVESGDYEFESPGDGHVIFNFESIDADGDEFFAFIAVPEPLAEKFHYLASSTGKQFNIADYGTIIKWGWGAASADDIAEFEKEFGKITVSEPA